MDASPTTAQDTVPAIDPVCGMSVDPATAKGSAVHAGKRYYFCSEGCKTRFAAAPETYLNADRFTLPTLPTGSVAAAPHDHANDPQHRNANRAPAGPPVAAGAIYTCPMHPEIRQDGPGDCPLCGMALGLHMSISQDHAQMPTHAHTMVAGWLMSAVFAFFYHLFPAAASTLLAKIHFWLTAVSGILLLIGLYFLLAGNEAVEPLVAAASMGFYAAMLLFAFIGLPAVWRRA